ncbi:uncharacterized protein (DUF2236 family) [Marmoricola sp. OAE513]|uniref:oxygenase MpaB family protein n=1 Tax=Marmoricola sp. OAE513 TaxID=2817894 RepID=UPI003395F4CB
MTSTLPDQRAGSRQARSAEATPDVRRCAEPGGILWESTGLVTFSLTTGSAFLLQTMEPSIGAVVDAHSTFRTDPIGRGLRSLASVMMWVYGDEESLVEVERLREMHATLNVTDENGVRHTALSSGPWAWVLLTGVHAYTEGAKYFGDGTDLDVDGMYEEMKQLMRGFKVAEKEIPPTYADFVPFFEQKIAEQLENNQVSQDFLAGIRHPGPPLGTPALLKPVWRLLTNPLGYVQYLATVGTVPQVARDKLGLTLDHESGAPAPPAREGRRPGGAAAARAAALPPDRLRGPPVGA